MPLVINTKPKLSDNLFIRLTIAAIISIVFVLLIKAVEHNVYVENMIHSTSSLGYWAPVAFIVLYTLMSGVFVPSIVFKVAAGTLFGVLPAVIIVSVASTVSSTIKFILARYFFQESISTKIESNRTLKTIDLMIERKGWKMLALIRNVPIASSMFVNYICGVTKMSMWDFVTASFIGRLPTIIMYAYLGYLIGVVSSVEHIGNTHVTIEWILLWVGMLASIVLTYYVIGVSKKYFQETAYETQ